MIYVCCTIFDAKAATYGAPYFMANKPVAIRAFKRLVQEPGSTVNSAPEDFSLFQLGEYDDQAATFNLFDAPQFLSNAMSLKD